MPSVPIYIRNEDYSKWLSIENKAEWLHNALNKLELIDLPMAYNLNTKKLQGKPIKNILTTIPGVVRGADFVPKPPDPGCIYG